MRPPRRGTRAARSDPAADGRGTTPRDAETRPADIPDGMAGADVAVIAIESAADVPGMLVSEVKSAEPKPRRVVIPSERE